MHTKLTLTNPNVWQNLILKQENIFYQAQTNEKAIFFHVISSSKPLAAILNYLLTVPPPLPPPPTNETCLIQFNKEKKITGYFTVIQIATYNDII
jgi:hypothetical protein